MKRLRFLASVVGTLGVVAIYTLVGPSAGNADSADRAPTARATIRDASGAVLGTLVLQQIRGNTVAVAVNVNRLPAGFHGFHVHAVGICNPATTDPTTGAPAPFLSAGPHFNPAATTHGDHAGDLPPLLVVQSGTATAAVETDRFTLASLFDADGSAIIVHAAPDNLANIPSRYVSSTTGQPGPDAATLGTGDSGSRVGCGVIQRQ
jgi:Cu-Zn family superoxide dismutase